MNHLQLLTERFGGALLVRPVVAGSVINMAKPSTYNRVAAGTFPIPLVNTSIGRMVRVADIADYLDNLTPIIPRPQPVALPLGRPTRAMEVAAKKCGLSVKEYRAQTSINLEGRAV